MARPPPAPRPWRHFLLNISLAVLLAVSAIYTGLAVSDQRAVEAELGTRGRALFGAIVLVRKWNSDHGGVFVQKREGMVSSPFLERPDREGTDGTVYTMKNPALMTREISEIAEREGLFRFHITSLRPINPGNAPDAFEREALGRFELGQAEAVGREVRDGAPWFRYMAPLLVDQSCLACHASQGYRVGDIRGGISVSFSMSEAEAAIRRTRWTALALFAATSGLLLLVIARLVSGLRGRLHKAEARIRQLADTDELTGIANRRRVSERLAEERVRSARYGRPLSVAMLDLDHFKEVNDAHGHAAGDAVLRGVTSAVVGALREADLLGRWGGEELLAILPETDAAGARALGERLRQAVESLRVEQGGSALPVTVSVGLTTWTPQAARVEGPSSEAMVKQADDAMYRAKQAGRNRVEA